jgi:hypothetical protein
LLKNLAYDKQLALVYSTDGWNTVQSADAFFGRSTYDNQEYWRFNLAIPNPGDDIRFAIRYDVAGETHWDNNLGRDYRVATP